MADAGPPGGEGRAQAATEVWPPPASLARPASPGGGAARPGGKAFGFRGDRWTRQRVAQLLQRELGVSYHPTQVGRLLGRWGWTRQKPVRRARQRDEAAIRAWREEQYPALVKKGPA